MSKTSSVLEQYNQHIREEARKTYLRKKLKAICSKYKVKIYEYDGFGLYTSSWDDDRTIAEITENLSINLRAPFVGKHCENDLPMLLEVETMLRTYKVNGLTDLSLTESFNQKT